MNTARYRQITSGHKGGERLVLSLIAMHAEEGAEPDVDGLALDTGLSAKQVLRITAKLKADGVIVVKGGTGRAPYTFALASANQDIMSSQAIQDVPSPQPTADILSSQEIRSQDKMSSLADARTKCPDKPARSEDKMSGTPVAPYSDIRTSTDTPQPSVEGGANAPPPAAKKKPASPISRLSESERAILELWRELAKAYPPEYAWPTIFGRVLDGFDAARFKRCGGAYLTHFGKGQRYVAGILDWYEQERTEPERNGNGKAVASKFGRPEITRDFSRFPRRAG